MNNFIFNERNAVRLSAVLAGQALQKEAPKTALGRMVADQIAAGQAQRLKTKATPTGGDPLAEALAGARRLIDDMEAVIAKFRSGGVQ